MAVMMAVKECGVGKFAEAVETATAQGMTHPQILAVVDFFRNHPGRWSEGVLFKRLTVKWASLNAPHEGWFGGKPGYRPPAPTEAPAQACDDLEALHGATLDALDDAELAILAKGLNERDRRDLPSLGRSHPDLRPKLIRLIAKRDRPSIAAQEFQTGEPSHAIPPPITRPQELTAAT